MKLYDCHRHVLVVGAHAVHVEPTLSHLASHCMQLNSQYLLASLTAAFILAFEKVWAINNVGGYNEPSGSTMNVIVSDHCCYWVGAPLST